MKRLWFNILVAAYRACEWGRARLLSAMIRSRLATKT
jgi:hypothetical protein